MANNKQLTATMRLNTTQAEKKLKRIARAFDVLNRAMGKQTNAYRSVNNALKTSTTQTTKVRNETDKWANSVNRVKANANSTNSVFKTVLSTVKKIAGAYLGIQTAKLAIETSDKITSTENRLNNLEDATPETTAETMDKVYAAAQRARTGYTGMLSNVSKTMTLAGDAFQGNIDNAIRFQEIMAKAYTVGGASATEASTSMYQLVQALGAGTLAGDELRSVREGAPLAYKAIEEFAQKAFNTKESLKDLASQGVITSNIVVAAIMEMENGADNINDKFENTAMTFGQAWEKIKNMTTRAFQPALQALNDALNNPAVQQGIAALGTGLAILGNLLSWVFSLVSWAFGIFGSFFNWCAENWSWLSKVILNVLTIVGIAMAVILFPKFIAWIKYIGFVIVYYTYLGAQALAAGIKAAIAWMAANWVLLLIIVIIAAVITALIWLSDGFSDACGIIVGVVMAAISVIWNLFVTLLTFVVKWVIMPLTTAWDNFANILGNLFNDPIGAIVKAFAKMADTVLSILETIAKGIDAVFGGNLTEKVQGWRQGLANKADELANKWGNGTYKEKSDVTGKLEDILNGVQDKALWDTSSAYNTGYEWGHAGGEWISDKLSSLGNMLGGVELPDPNDPSLGLGDSYDPSGANDDILAGLDELNGTTKDIEDKLDLRDDDLEFLRRIAEMEWRKEFTTAEIKIDMTNHNTVNGDRDLDGIVEYLSDALRTEMTVVANGVHY